MRRSTRAPSHAVWRRYTEERHDFHGSSLLTRLNNKWGAIQVSFWFIPSVMSAAAMVLAVLMLYLDRTGAAELPVLQEIAYSGGADGARTILSAVASSMIGIAGVTFSITIVALTLASGHFGPRLLRNFMKDLGNQIVLGTYIATFIYCLWVLQTVRDTDSLHFVPGLSVSFALLLALAGLVVLIYFFHHVSTSIQADHVIADAFFDLVHAVDRKLMDREDFDAEDSSTVEASVAESIQWYEKNRQWETVLSAKSGYIQAVDYSYLLNLAKRHDLALEVTVRAGDFLVEGQTVTRIFSEEELEDFEALQRTVNNCLFTGQQKTAEQDLEFSLDQMVEIAVRALSPGVNDPGTAVTCVDYLGAILAKAAGKRFPVGVYSDEEGTHRVLARTFTFSGMFDAAFYQIRQNCMTSVAVNLRLLEVFAELAPLMRTDEQKTALRRHADMVHRSCRRNFQEPNDRDAAAARYTAVLQYFDEA